MDDKSPHLADPTSRLLSLKQCKQGTEELLTLFEKAMQEKGIDPATAEQLLNDIRPEADRITDSINACCVDRMEHEHEKEEVERHRQDHLGRVITRPLEPLIPPEDFYELQEQIARECVEGRLPRQVIPGFVAAVKDMFGSEYVDEKQRTIAELAARHLKPWGTRTDWKKVHADPETEKVVKEVLQKAKEKLEDPEVKEWFIGRIVNSDPFGIQMKREFDEREFDLLFKTLFQGL